MSDLQQVSSVIQDIRLAIDIEGATVRHTDASLLRMINQSNKELQEFASNSGSAFYLDRLRLTYTDDYVNDEDGYGTYPPYYTLPDNVFRIYKVYYKYDNNTISLSPISLVEQDEYSDENILSGYPAYYSLNKKKLHVFPSSTQDINIVYLPYTTALTSDGYIDGINGWTNYIVYDVANKIALRDNLLQQIQFLNVEFEKAKLYVKTNAKIQSDKPLVRIDTLGLRAKSRSRRFP